MFVNGILIGLGIFVAWFILIPLIGLVLSLIPLAFFRLLALFSGKSPAPSAKMSRRELKRRQALGYDSDLPLPPPWWKGVFFQLNLLATLRGMFGPARDVAAYRRKLGYDMDDEDRA